MERVHKQANLTLWGFPYQVGYQYYFVFMQTFRMVI